MRKLSVIKDEELDQVRKAWEEQQQEPNPGAYALHLYIHLKPGMVASWWNRTGSVYHFDWCHLRVGQDWRGELRGVWLGGKLSLWYLMNGGGTEPSGHVATGFPAYAVREGMLETVKSTEQGPRGVYLAPHLEGCVPLKRKKRERELQIQAGLQSPLLTFRPRAIYSHGPKPSFFSSTKLRKPIRLPRGINEVIMKISSNAKGIVNGLW